MSEQNSSQYLGCSLKSTFLQVNWQNGHWGSLINRSSLSSCTLLAGWTVVSTSIIQILDGECEYSIFSINIDFLSTGSELFDVYA